MSRKLAREMAMKLMYQMEIQNDFSPTILERFISELPEDVEQNTYIRHVVNTYITNKDAVDKVIREHSIDWELDRMPKVDAAILRLAITEILYREDIPESVSINEAVELAKNYSTNQSGSFINGVLGSLVEKK